MASATCPEDGSPTDPVQIGPVPAALLSRFGTFQPFASGATGTLYAGNVPESTTPVLLKVYAEHVGASLVDRTRIKRELLKQAPILHPHLPRILDEGEASGRLWLLRELIAGETLAVQLRLQRQLSVDVALSVAAQLASALDELHRQGLVHRDVKPGHVILSTRGDAPAHIRLIDMGAAARLAVDSPLESYGTAAYAAPEIASGKPASFRSDLYALGCLLYEMLAGTPPFPGASVEAVLTAQRSQEPAPLNVELAPPVHALLNTLLAKDPRRRPFSAQQVRRALDPFLPDGVPAAPPAGRSVAPPPPVSTSTPPPRTRTRTSTPPPPIPSMAASRRPPADQTQELSPEDLDRATRVAAASRTQEIELADIEAMQPGITTEELELVDLEGVGPSSNGEDRTATGERMKPAAPQSDEDSSPTIAMPPRSRKSTTIGHAQPAAQPPAATNGTASAEFDLESLFDEEDKPSEQRLRARSVQTPVVGKKASERPPARVDESGARRAPSERPSGPAVSARDAAISGREATQPTAAEPPPEARGSRSRTATRMGVTADIFASAKSAIADVFSSASTKTPVPERGTVADVFASPGGTTSSAERGAVADVFVTGSGGELPATELPSDSPIPVAGASAPSDLGHAANGGGHVAAYVQPEEATSRGLGRSALSGVAAAPADSPVEPAAEASTHTRHAVDDAAEPPQADVPGGAFGAGEAYGSSATPDDDEGSVGRFPSDGPQAPAMMQMPRDSELPPSAAGVGRVKPASLRPTQRPDTRRQPWLLLWAIVALILIAVGLRLLKGPDKHVHTVATKPVPTEAAPTVPDNAQVANDVAQGDVIPPPPAAEIAAAQGADTDTQAAKQETDESGRTLSAQQAGKGFLPDGGPSDPSGVISYKQRPRNDVDYKAKGRQLFQSGKYRQAAEAYQHASQKAPSDAAAFAGLGASWLKANQADRSIAAYQRAVQLQPDVSGFQAALGRAYVIKGDKGRARAAYQKAIALDPNNQAAKTGIAALDNPAAH